MSDHTLASAPQTSIDPYLAILQFAELELELAGRGEIEHLASLAARWDSLTAGIPPAAPAGAAALLERAMLVHERAQIELIRLREALLADLNTTVRARRAARGYSPSAPQGAVLDQTV
ncbi:MAG TPA: hypothetical protein VID48_12140 [Solirubrobacteraceae bacterium]